MGRGIAFPLCMVAFGVVLAVMPPHTPLGDTLAGCALGLWIGLLCVAIRERR